MVIISDMYWNSLTSFNDSTMGLKETNDYGKQWINEIIQRLNSIEDDAEAIQKMFAIQQKIGMVKAKYTSFSSFGTKYPLELYRKLEITLNILMKERLK